MKTSLQYIALLLIGSVLAGCSYINPPSVIQGRDKQYLTATTVQPIRVPPGLSSSQFKNRYPIPERNYPDNLKTVNITPPGLSS